MGGWAGGKEKTFSFEFYMLDWVRDTSLFKSVNIKLNEPGSVIIRT